MEVEAVRRYHNLVPLKKPVCLVSREGELVQSILNPDGVTSRHLLPVLKGNIVREGHLAQTQEAEETCEDHGHKEEVVVARGILVMVDYELKVIDGQGTFTCGGCPSHPHAALECATDEGRVACCFDGREVSFKLLRYAR